MSEFFLCRTCAKTRTENMIKIFEEKNIQLLRQIKRITGITLQYDKNLPQYICEDCFKDLQKAIEFRLRFLSAQYYFTTKPFLEKLELTRKNLEQNNETSINNDTTEVEVHIERHQMAVSDLDENEDTLFEASDEPKRKKVQRPKKKYKRSVNKDLPKQSMVCDICGKLFPARQFLMKHLERHMGDRRFQCEFCEFKCYSGSQLDVHRRLHTGERPYSCDLCGERFINLKNARRHKRLHENVRPYACTYCDKTFLENCNLKTHLISHTGISRFNCSECKKVYQSNALLLKHYKSNSHLQTVAMLEQSEEHVIDENDN